LTAAEEGVLLLCCRLGDPNCKPLTPPQFRELGLRVRAAGSAADPLRDLHASDLLDLRYNTQEADRILRLLDREDALHNYLCRGEAHGIYPLTRLSRDYPAAFRALQGFSAVPVLFYRGDISLLRRPSIAVVGSRKLYPQNEAFARRAGQLAAEHGLVLVSGGAAGADRAAQEACLQAGGQCVIYVSDQLEQHPAHSRILYISADGYDLPFSTPRAMTRNSLIHMHSRQVLAAQCTYGSGGTWHGCLENLKHGWSDLFVFDDGSAGMCALKERGATGIADLQSLDALKKDQLTLF